MSDLATPRETSASRDFYEKAYRRQTLADWDRKWYGLSTGGRHFVLSQFLFSAHGTPIPRAAPGYLSAMFTEKVLNELKEAGIVELHQGRAQGDGTRVTIRDSFNDFAERTRTLRRYHLLTENQTCELAGYVKHVYFVDQLIEVLSGVLRGAGLAGPFTFDDILNRYVVDHLWPEWVAASLNEPLAFQILDVARNANGPISLAGLPDQFVDGDPNRVRTVIDQLIVRLALFEDIRPSTSELVVGLLPTVRKKTILASMPRERPPLVEANTPRELGPVGCPVVNDIRAVLLEVASEPPRLRQDHALFHKEIARFQSALDPLPDWILDAMKWTGEGRLNRAITWARALGLARAALEANQIGLRLTDNGNEWLSSGAPEDGLKLYDFLRMFQFVNDLYSPHLGLFLPGVLPGEVSGPADTFFLGTHVAALRMDNGKRRISHWQANQADYLALRAQLDAGLSLLKPGVFYRLDSVESHLVFDRHNPLNLGLPANQVEVFLVTRATPPDRPEREEIARQVIHTFVMQRLVPFGCMRAAQDESGQLCVARGPRFDALFGRRIPRAAPTPGSDGPSKVVIQPDFSVVIIGSNPAPVVALSPFCERTSRGGGQGATVMKLTRESVVKAIKNGLPPAEIMARLVRHASKELPANVRREVQEWSKWVRRVTCTSLIGLRCPDSETADRVMGVMKRHAERVNSTTVAIDRKKLTTIERNKLKEHGILLEEDPDYGGTPSKLGARRKR